jgi:hypothetical protein
MTTTQHINGASPAAGIGLIERMAGSGNDQLFLDRMAQIASELQSLRGEVANLTKTVLRLEAQNTHEDVADLTKRVGELEKQRERYEGRAETWKVIVTGLTILTGLLSIASFVVAFKK